MFSASANSNSTTLPRIIASKVAAYPLGENKSESEAATAAPFEKIKIPEQSQREDTSLKAVCNSFSSLWSAIQKDGLEKAALSSVHIDNTAAHYMAWFLAGQMTAWSDESLKDLSVQEAWRVARVLYSAMVNQAVLEEAEA
jgi:hypothetical protein